MKTYHATLEWNHIGFITSERIGTRAISALSSIEGVFDIELISESDNQAKASYKWSGTSPPAGVEEQLARHGLRRVD